MQDFLVAAAAHDEKSSNIKDPESLGAYRV